MAGEKMRMSARSPLNELGINLSKVHCPRCRKQMPAMRIPIELHEILWGGWTCPHCECRMNKWGYGVEPDVSEPPLST